MIYGGRIVNENGQDIEGPYPEGTKAFWISSDPEIVKRTTPLEVKREGGIWESRDSIRITGKKW